jgi:multidrug transporter EmrE-like cation transporter
MSEPARIAWDVSMNGWLLTGAILHVTALALWVAGLRQVELSVAYPFIALGLVLVSTLSWMFLGESMNVARIAGILLIAAGVLVVARA